MNDLVEVLPESMAGLLKVFLLFSRLFDESIDIIGRCRVGPRALLKRG